MLYEVFFGVLILYLMLAPFIMINGIKFGIKLAEKPQETAEQPIFNVPKKKKKPKMSKDEERAISILANIDAYDGTGMGQKEIK